MEKAIQVEIKNKNIKMWFNSLIGNIEKVIQDPDFQVAAHNLLAKKMNPYVPMMEGNLSQDVLITASTGSVDNDYITIAADGVTYKAPYAHYMYEGIVYGPNIPIIQDGRVVGFFSRKGVAKSPTGKMIEYNKEKHSKATRHWDEAMMAEKGDELADELVGLILKKLEEK